MSAENAPSESASDRARVWARQALLECTELRVSPRHNNPSVTNAMASLSLSYEHVTSLSWSRLLWIQDYLSKSAADRGFTLSKRTSSAYEENYFTYQIYVVPGAEDAG